MAKKVHHSKAAMKHPDVLGAGAKKRKKIRDPKKRFSTVMAEFKRGTLHPGGSHSSTKNKKQAIAIALSEKKDAEKRNRQKKKR